MKFTPFSSATHAAILKMTLICVAGAMSFSAWRLSVTPRVLPEDRVASLQGWADERRCAECHEQARDFWQTGHALTLSAADTKRSADLLKTFRKSSPPGANSLEIRELPDGFQAIDASHETPRELGLDWCFGSGRHACTWVGTLPDSWGMTDLVEFRWTWYHQQNAFEVTPGQPEQPGSGSGYFENMGVMFDHPKARHCFACHTSYLPVHAGRIDEARIKAGVTCQRCHGPLEQHVSTAGKSQPPALRTLSQMESIQRCAQCHRRADEREPDEIRTDNPAIVRFQPVGLVQSPCFKNSPTMTCTTCHDPHRPMEAQDSLGLWQCMQCHNPKTTQHTLCGAGRVDDCLDCHMPKVRSEAPVLFTDHWIRVREHDKAHQ